MFHRLERELYGICEAEAPNKALGKTSQTLWILIYMTKKIDPIVLVFLLILPFCISKACWLFYFLHSLSAGTNLNPFLPIEPQEAKLYNSITSAAFPSAFGCLGNEISDGLRRPKDRKKDGLWYVFPVLCLFWAMFSGSSHVPPTGTTFVREQMVPSSSA